MPPYDVGRAWVFAILAYAYARGDVESGVLYLWCYSVFAAVGRRDAGRGVEAGGNDPATCA